MRLGFTLVELMVVVVIIGVLVAIAVPVYNSITGDAADKADQATLRTVNGAVMMYDAANGEKSFDGTIADLVGDFLQETPTLNSGTLTWVPADHKFIIN
ncbi:MAG TPA: prepilin-type N-terminal cleavage/methylation domain-containing protein [Oscillospiraceae bacterium]|nr:prepilin-type N-terminal cleavage/methylation domain-containing protein [Oscillospiraceae bacterium]